MLRKNRLIVTLVFILLIAGGVYALVRTPIEISRAELDRSSRLLAPFSNSVTFTLDPNDTFQSAIQMGEPVKAVSFDGDLRDLPQVGPEEKTLNVEFEPAGIEPTDPDYVDPVVQGFSGMMDIPSASASFAGLDLQNWGAGWPPDTQGDVGPNHYIQAVNTSIGVYNKSTGARLAAFTFDTLFAGTGTPCDADNNGDPVVLYDAVSGRWILSDFAWTDFVNGPYYECIAVSKTADPVSGGWWFYGIVAHPSWLNDYPKMGVWHDGIYMTANMFDILSSAGSASYKGVRIWALNRDDLINGLPLRFQYGDLGSAYFSLLPANADVNQAPAGTPNYLGSLQTTSSFYTWKLSIDWANTAGSVLSGPFSTPIAAFSNASSVPQASSAVTLDSLAGRLMANLQYSNASGQDALWVTHSVATSGRAGVRWYEFRNLSGTPSVHQQGTYSPDSTHRWMGSVAVDSQGNMAVVYSASSTSINPQIRYAGRLAGDPLGLLSQGEATLIAGNGAQTTYSRWGDYAAMSVDPDGCTIWFTTEYYASTGTNWQTRIGSFAFPGCGGGVPPTPTPVPPTPTPIPTAVPPTPTPQPGSGTIYLSSAGNGSVGGVSFNDEDIVEYNLATGTWSLYFDGSDVGVTGDINAFRVNGDGTILMSFDAGVSITGLGSVDDSDIVKFTSTSLGSNTAGSFSWYFDGSDVGLSTNAEDIDTVALTADGRILISTTGSFGVTGVSGQDEDLIAFTPTSLGSTTAGTWSLYFDGSDVGLDTASSEDVNGGWMASPSGDLYLTTLGSFSVTGLSGTGSDIFACTGFFSGSSTSCAAFTMFFQGSTAGWTQVTDGFTILP